MGRKFLEKLKNEDVFREGEVKILLMAPPKIRKMNEKSLSYGFSEKSVNASSTLSEHYEKLAVELDVEFLDAAQIIETTDTDQIHFEADEHRKLGVAVADVVQKLHQVTATASRRRVESKK